MDAPRQHSASFVNAVAILYIVLLSSCFVAIKIGLRSWPPMMLAGTRFMIAAIVTGGIGLAIGVPWPRERRAWFRLVCLGSLNMMLPACFNFLALQRVSAGMAAIVLSTNPLLLTLIAPWLLSEKMTWSRGLGIALGFGGVVGVMIVRVGAGGKADTPLGVALLGLAAVSMVTGTVFFKRFPPLENLWVINTVQQGVGALLLIPLSFLIERPLDARIGLPVLGSLFYMALVVSVGAGLLWFWLLARGEASAVSAFYFLSPISGLLLGSLLTGEGFGVREGLGLVVVCSGIVLIRRKSKTAPAPAAAGTKPPTVRPPPPPPPPPPPAEDGPKTTKPAASATGSATTSSPD